MRKYLLLAAALLLPAVTSAQGSGGYLNGLYCAHPGFNVNVGVTTKSFLCAPKALIRGNGTLSFAVGDNTVTCTPLGGLPDDCFKLMAAIDAVGAEDTFFNRSGLIARFDSIGEFWTVTARTSDTEIEVVNGTTAPATTRTTTDWSYWNTTCYRSAGTQQQPAADTDLDDQRLWAVLGRSTYDFVHFQMPQAFVGVVGNNSTLSATNFVDWVRPAGIKVFGITGTQTTFGANIAGTVKMGNSWSNQGSNALFETAGVEFTAACQSTNADAYPFICLVRGE